MNKSAARKLGRAECGAGVKAVSIKHNLIMDYLLANPTTKLRDVAEYFGVTQSWLSTIIHSHAFQAELAEKKEALFSGVVVSVAEKTTAVTHQILDQMGNALDEQEMPFPLLADTADKLLKNLGFGPKSSPNSSTMQNNQTNVYIGMNEIKAAQMRMQNKSLTHSDVKVLDYADTGTETPDSGQPEDSATERYASLYKEAKQEQPEIIDSGSKSWDEL